VPVCCPTVDRRQFAKLIVNETLASSRDRPYRILGLNERTYPLTRIRLAALIVMGLLQGIQTVHPADLPLKTKHEQAVAPNRERNIGPIEKEILFQQFLEWLQNRRDQNQAVPLRGSFTR
jgi:hypothetical protein